ncbi:MAG: GNAT family N-acetyltransferase [Pseudomonadota bacterium]
MQLQPLGHRDAKAACALYLDLTRSGSVAAEAHFQSVVDHTGTVVVGAFEANTLIGMGTLHVLPNMTYGGQPYAFIENVVTAQGHRKRGVGRAVLENLIARAWAANAYKIMLLTGQARGARGFYQKLGFNDIDKHGMVLRRD